MSFIARLWNSIKSPVRYVGRDLLGNKFYEAYSPNDPSRPKRTVQYYEPEDMWKYIGGNKRLAIQWSSWLTHTRPNPPTIEELQSDVIRQQRLSQNVALIEARDRAESEEMLRIRQHDAARALEEAESRNDRLLPVRESKNAIEDPQMVPSVTTNFTSEATPQHHPSPSTSSSTQPMRNVQPPKFLTPATPRKPRTSAKFALPSIEVEESVSSQGQQSQSPKRETTNSHEAATGLPPSMPSRLASEAESWTPKARRRG